MQKAVENFDFDKYYTTAEREHSTQVKVLHQEQQELHGCIQSSTLVYSNRALNISVAYASCSYTEIAPYLIFRFDVRQINDLVTFRVGKERKQHWIIAACNDGYTKVFAPQTHSVIKVIKGVSGNPLCISVAGVGHLPRLQEQRDLMAVGYEDDSFVVYSILRDF